MLGMILGFLRRGATVSTLVFGGIARAAVLDERASSQSLRQFQLLRALLAASK
jgi:hypothetical protein